MTKNILIRNVPNYILERLNEEAKLKNINRSELIREIFKNYFENINYKIREEEFKNIINENSKLIKINIELLNQILGE